MERKQKKDEGGRRVFLSVLKDCAGVFILHFHSWLRVAAKEKLQASLTSARALNDRCALICFLPTVLQTDIIMSPPHLTAGIMPLNLCGFYFKSQYNGAFSM